ncbi:DUF2971 domain-containing protein [Psychroserpens ponticola]|uniref:DUF2971 domain-containing protein n=1 Tax=Psychroserpens ponticola TaxID=2932268 RepID=A0ABY7RU02_9FLAO|nr:DUF2971 domain-containing protein [Psychroserpens ponticola]WCO00582.1 DUF2971 domain-containing protein [Psychroserpens ponticola]
MKQEIIFKTLDHIEFPEILFKYRDWNNKFNKRFIIEREVFMASPNQFEDKLDCKSPVRYDLMSAEQAKSVYTRISNLDENLSRQQKRKRVRELLDKKDYLNPEFNENYQKKYFKGYFERLGILSLTAENCLDSMWEKYANNHSGFCVGYNSRILFNFLGGGGKVEYPNELPILLPDPIMSREEMRWKQVYYKEKKWEFEKEYRTQKFWEHPATMSDRQIPLPKEAFNCIILGKNMNESDRTEIINSIRNNIGDIEIKEHKSVC